jgi:hypothetical protein
MLTTGTQLRCRLTALRLQLDAQTKAFDEALRRYPNEVKDPLDAMRQLALLEQEIALLQTAQQWYNLQIQIELPPIAGVVPEGTSVTLATAVKWLGSLGRAAKMWRTALPSKERYRMSTLDTRRSDEEHETYTLPTSEVIAQVTLWSNAAATVQTRIALANTREIEIPWLNGLNVA